MRVDVKNLIRQVVQKLYDDYESYIYTSYGDVITNESEVIEETVEIICNKLECIDDIFEVNIKGKHDNNFNKLNKEEE